MSQKQSLQRRDFLKFAGVSGASLLFTGCSVFDFVPDIPSRPDSNLEDASLWISLENGSYHLYLPRIEMGQNITTALKQVACEELGIEWAELQVHMQSTNKINPVKSTVGSESVMLFAIPLAQACASFRDAITAGKTQGQVIVTERPLEQLRCFASHCHFVGKSVQLEQALEIATGKPLYVSDVRLPNMLYGTVVYPDCLPELPCELLSFQRNEVAKIPGFVALVEHPLLTSGLHRGIGLIAQTPYALAQMEKALDAKWSKPQQSFCDDDLAELLDIDKIIARNDLPKTVREQKWQEISDDEYQVDMRLDIPSAAHTPMEPRAAVADFSDASAPQIWVGNQDAFFIKDKLTRRMSLAKDALTVHACRIGGAFGGKTICTVEMEAAVLSQYCQRTVKVQWSREQEYLRGFHRPPCSHRIRARVENGKITHWYHGFVSSHILFTNAVAPQWMQGITNLVVGDPGVARGADLHYQAEAQKIQYALKRLPWFTGPWRGLGAGANYLAIESAIDQCAVISRIDPYEFRARNLNDKRLLGVLHKVAKSSDWLSLNCSEYSEPCQPANNIRTGKGIACGIYKNTSYGATVVKVTVFPDGKVNLDAIYSSHDCGKILNPDQVKAQCEGNVVWGMSFVFHDNLQFASGALRTRQLQDSPIPRSIQIPAIHVDLIENNEAPTGAGETLMVSVMGAICNAVFDATGHRVSRLPLQTDALKLKLI